MFLNSEQEKALKILVDYNTGKRDFTSTKDSNELREALLILEKEVKRIER
jgi:hypothetical protein